MSGSEASREHSQCMLQNSKQIIIKKLFLETETSEDILHSINADHSYARSCNALSKNDRYKTGKKFPAAVSNLNHSLISTHE